MIDMSPPCLRLVVARWRPILFFWQESGACCQLASELLSDGSGTSCFVLPVTDLPLHLLLRAGDLRHDEDRPEHPARDETRDEAGHRQVGGQGPDSQTERSEHCVRTIPNSARADVG